MALVQLTSLPFSSTEIHCLKRKSSSLILAKSFKAPTPIQCKASNINVVSNDHSQTVLRRSANYQPSVWNYDNIQSLSNEYKNESYIKQNKALREEVRTMLLKVINYVDQLELVDVLQRLGVAYHFEDEIRNILDNIYNMETFKKRKNLHATALEFRLLRQHGYDISADIFDCFLDGTNNFKEFYSINVEEILSLYEASFLSMEGETTLKDATVFTSNFMKEYVNKNSGNYISLLINHALVNPLHWRMPRWEAHCFINMYGKSNNFNPTLLRFAKLDFNLLQSIYQEELKCASRWWETVGLVDKLGFCRDRLVENFIWGQGMNFRPELGYFRMNIAKSASLITTIDDIYDVYGTIEELELFTEAIDKWDLNCMESLPSYMNICFLALHNFVNDMAFEALKQNGNIIIPYLRKSWADLCKSYLIEAKWYRSGYTPRFGEYMENAWISTSGHVLLVHAYFSVPNPSRNEDLGLGEYPNIIRYSAMLLRLANDLGSAQGESTIEDVPKGAACYMNETGASKADSCEHIKSVIRSTWEMMDKEVRKFPFNQDFLDIATNLGRSALFFYENDDHYTTKDPETNSRILSLAMKPIPMGDAGKIVENPTTVF